MRAGRAVETKTSDGYTMGCRLPLFHITDKRSSVVVEKMQQTPKVEARCERNPNPAPSQCVLAPFTPPIRILKLHLTIPNSIPHTSTHHEHVSNAFSNVSLSHLTSFTKPRAPHPPAHYGPICFHSRSATLTPPFPVSRPSPIFFHRANRRKELATPH